MPPGRRRLTCVAHNLPSTDGLRDRGVARPCCWRLALSPLSPTKIARRNHASAELCEADFVALKRPHPYEERANCG